MDGETRNRAVSLISKLEGMVIDTSTEFDNLEQPCKIASDFNKPVQASKHLLTHQKGMVKNGS